MRTIQQLANKWDTDLYDGKHAFVSDYGTSLISLLDPRSHEYILDLGCGSGVLTAQIAEKAKEVVGMDLSPEMVAKAQKQFPLLTFEERNASNFKFERPFDAIFSNATLHWVTDYRNAAKCMFNNLKAGGRMVVEFGGKHNIEAIVSELRTSLASRGYVRQASLQPWYFPSIAEYTGVLEQVGFQVTLAQWYDRPTELADSAQGIFDWLTMFAQPFFNRVATPDKNEIKLEIQEKLKDKLFKTGRWFADYKRIRIIANKTYY